jgi:hypothetical protein
VDDAEATTGGRGCLSCGRDLAAGDQFCSSCGYAADPGFGGLVMTEGTAAPVDTLTAADGGRGRVLASAVTGLLVAVLAGSLLVGPGSPHPGQAVAPESTGLPSPAPVDIRPSTTVPSTTTPRATAAAPSVGTGPLFGRPTGLVVIQGNGSAIEAVDLDTGEVAAVGRGELPLALVGDRLIVTRSSQQPGVWSLPYRAGGDPSDEVPLGEGWEVATVAGRSDVVWVSGWDEDRSTWTLVDVTTGDRLERVAHPPQTMAVPSFGGPGTAVGPELAATGDGGLYQRVNGEYRRVATGALLAAGTEVAVLRRCDERLRCAVVWLDRRTWQEVDRAPLPGPFDWVTLSPSGRWARLSDHRAETQTLVDSHRGMSWPLAASYDILAFSPDESFVAYHTTTGQLVVVDLEAPDEPVPFWPGSPMRHGLLLVDRPPVPAPPPPPPATSPERPRRAR